MPPRYVRLVPGVYEDPETGTLHLSVPELLVTHGYADTPQNRETLARVARTFFPGRTRVIEEDPC